MPDPARVQDLIVGIGAWFVAAPGARAVLDVTPSGTLAWSREGLVLPKPGDAAVAEAPRWPWASIWSACLEWRMITGIAGFEASGEGSRIVTLGPAARDVRGARFEFVADGRVVTGEWQAPETVAALGDFARAFPEARVTVRLPAGVRDVQRARAALPSGSRRSC